MFRETSELSLTRQAPGMLAGWVVTVITIASAVSFVAASVGTAYLWDELPSWVELGWFRHAMTFFISFWLLTTWLPQWPLSRALRVAVLLPLAHAIMIACAWPVWVNVAPHVFDETSVTAVARAPLAWIAIGTAVAFALFAAAIVRRRSGEWIHAFAVLALTNLLLLGLWLPLACTVWSGGDPAYWDPSSPLLTSAAKQIAFTVAPPTVAALVFTYLHIRRPARLAAGRAAITTTLALLLALAVLFRLTASARAMVVYSNMLPLVLAAVLVAVASLVALGAVTWWRSATRHRAFSRCEQRGATIVDDGDEPVIGLEITSWLRGPRVVQRPFSVATSSGILPARGAHLIAAVPAGTTQLEIGERIAVLRPRDDVRIAGHDAAGGDPFRTSAAPIVDAMYVAPADLSHGGFASAALVMWRPCVAYLLIVSAVALPALAALAAE